MKNIIIIALLFVGLFLGCQPEPYEPIGDPIERPEQITGTYALQTFIQEENAAVAKGFPDDKSKIDLTYAFEGHPYSDFSLTLNADATFSTELGNSYVQMLSDGTWAFDDDDFPTALVLTSGSDIQTVNIGNFADLFEGSLQLSVERKDQSGKVIITYKYNLQKQ